MDTPTILGYLERLHERARRVAPIPPENIEAMPKAESAAIFADRSDG
jgi:hypothetical protein